MQILRKSLLYRQFVTLSDKNHYFNANTNEIITLHTVYDVI